MQHTDGTRRVLRDDVGGQVRLFGQHAATIMRRQRGVPAAHLILDGMERNAYGVMVGRDVSSWTACTA
jgi:hypothetical protein